MKPISEEFKLMNSEVIVVGKGQVFDSPVIFDLSPEETIEKFFNIELHEGSVCRMNIFIRGSGNLILYRKVRVLNHDAVLSFRVSGDVCKKASVFISDDVELFGKKSLIDLSTKIVLRDEAYSRVRQRVVIGQESGGAEVRQGIEHLLLGNDVRAEGIPELEVGLDDVICSHMATASKPSEELLFYLASRGFDDDGARKMVIHGFLA